MNWIRKFLIQIIKNLNMESLEGDKENIAIESEGKGAQMENVDKPQSFEKPAFGENKTDSNNK